MRGLYIHIPFCNSICTYCDFPKRLSDSKLFDKYIDRVIEELDYYNDYLNKIDSVYIGGGTPNVLPLNLLEKLFKRIENVLNNSIENSIELNPELIDLELCKLLKKYNFNRVSLGIQTLNLNSIKLLNRHHDESIIINAFNLLRNVGINNINCDLIFGIPYTNIDNIKYDLDFIINLDPTHISYYSLILEDKSILKYKVDKNEIELLDDDTISNMYDYINDYLDKHNYIHYEISNYSKLGYESIHNLKYWSELEYIGVGLAASGFINNTRYTNNKGIFSYFKSFLGESELITLEAKKNEFMMLGLRKIKGIYINDYKDMFNSSPLIDFKDIIDKYLKLDFIEIVDNHIRIKKDKLFIANVLWSEFV